MPKKQREKAGNHTINMDPRAEPTQEAGNQYYQRKEDENHHIFAEVPTKGISCENTIPDAILDEEKETREDPQFISEMIEQRGTTNTNAAIEFAQHDVMATISIEKEANQLAKISDLLQEPAELCPKPPPMSPTKSIHSNQSSPIKSDGYSSENSNEQDSSFETTTEETPLPEKSPPKAVETPMKTIGKEKAPPSEDKLLTHTTNMEERDHVTDTKLDRMIYILESLERLHQTSWEFLPKMESTIVESSKNVKENEKTIKQLGEEIRKNHAVNQQLNNLMNSTLEDATRTIKVAHEAMNSHKYWNDNTNETTTRHLYEFAAIVPRMENAVQKLTGYCARYPQEALGMRSENVAPQWNHYPQPPPKEAPKEAIETTIKRTESTCTFCGLYNHTSEKCKKFFTWFDRRERLTEMKKCHHCLEVYEPVEFCGAQMHTNCPSEDSFCKYCKALRGTQRGWKDTAAHHPAVCEHAPKEYNTQERPIKKGRYIPKRDTTN